MPQEEIVELLKVIPDEIYRKLGRTKQEVLARENVFSLPKINPTKTKAWKSLKALSKHMKKQYMRDMFAADPQRFSKYSIPFDDLLVDFSNFLQVKINAHIRMLEILFSQIYHNHHS